MPSEPVSRPWRRFLRFSVRGLIVVVLVIAGGLGWVVRSAHVQRDAVTAINDAGGGVRYDWQWKNGKYVRGGQPWAPRWLVDLIGVDYFGHVTGVVLCTHSLATDAAIVQLEHFTRLEELCLDESSVRDEGLSHLTGLTALDHLDLSGTKITDAGLSHLKAMTNLSRINLVRSKVSDTGMAELKRSLPRCDIAH